MRTLAARAKDTPLLQKQAQWDRLLGGVFCTDATKIGELGLISLVCLVNYALPTSGFRFPTGPNWRVRAAIPQSVPVENIVCLGDVLYGQGGASNATTSSICVSQLARSRGLGWAPDSFNCGTRMQANRPMCIAGGSIDGWESVSCNIRHVFQTNSTLLPV